MSTKHVVHASLQPRTVWVQEQVFYNMDRSKTAWVKAKLIGLTILKNQVPLFEILTDDGALFSNVPPTSVIAFDPSKAMVPPEKAYLEDLVYFNAPSETFSMCVFDHLASQHAYVFGKDRQYKVHAQYLCSIDFYQDNNWCHMLINDDGYFMFMPSHKILFKPKYVNKFSVDFSLPDYEKLRQEFSL